MPSNSEPPTVTTAAGEGVNTLFYSWDAGLVHYIALDTEIFGPKGQGGVKSPAMLNWLRADLGACAINRPLITMHD